jgi:hypothetical protein
MSRDQKQWKTDFPHSRKSHFLAKILIFRSFSL